MTPRKHAIAAGLIAWSISSCGGLDAPLDPTATPEARDLAIDARGEDVRALHDYLTQYGYFPNADLARNHPAWRPKVAEPPAAADVFDRHTRDAVAQLQLDSGLPATGVVDAATRESLQQARCGALDSPAALDPSDKFAWLFPNLTWWTRGSTLTYKVLTSTFPALIRDRIPALAAAAFNTWAAESSIQFQTTTGTPQITIQFGAVGQPAWPSETIIRINTSNVVVNSTITISNNPSKIWSVQLPGGTCPTNSGIDMQGMLTHEIGHVLGLNHSNKGSSSTGTIMWPTIGDGCRRRNLNIDDQVSVSSRYDNYQALPGITGARDVAVSQFGQVWVVSSVPHPSGRGFKIGKWDPPSTLTLSDNAYAIRIAIGPEERPWFIDNQGGVYHFSSLDPVTGFPVLYGGNASDIGVGTDGSVWVIGGWCGGGDCPIFKWSDALNGWEQDVSGGMAVRISVGPTGIPWVLTASKNFYRYSTNNPQTGFWSLVTGLSDDLGIGPRGNVWSYGRQSNGNLNLALWDEQTAIAATAESVAVAAVTTWTAGRQPCSAGPLSALAVGRKDAPYVVCSDGTVMAPNR